MSSFLSVPYWDIRKLLTDNNLAIPVKIEDAYILGWNFIVNNPGVICPTSIIDFVIALNLANQQVIIPVYESSFILQSFDKDLSEISKSLFQSEINKERIIRTLGYLGKLDNNISVFARLPNEILFLVLSYLDHRIVVSIPYISKQFYEFYLSLAYDSILRTGIDEIRSELLYKNIDLMKYSKSQLRNLYLLGKKKHLYITSNYAVLLTESGKVYIFQYKQCNPHIERDEIIQINEVGTIKKIYSNHYTTHLVNDKGTIYALNHEIDSFTQSVTIIPMVINKLDEKNFSEDSMDEYYVEIDGDGVFESYGNLHFIKYVEPFLLTDTGFMYQYYEIEGSENYEDYENSEDLSIERKYNVLRDLLLIGELDNVIQITGRYHRVLALNSNGKVYCLRDHGNQCSAEVIPELNNIIEIESCFTYGIAIDNEGKIYFFNFLDNSWAKRMTGIPHLISDFNLFLM